jgi:hypothetical protein
MSPTIPPIGELAITAPATEQQIAMMTPRIGLSDMATRPIA